MLFYLIICRSLTYAQRTAAILERVGITARVLRSPKSIDAEGCSHAVRISERSLSVALKLLAKEEMMPKRVFVITAEGMYREVYPS